MTLITSKTTGDEVSSAEWNEAATAVNQINDGLTAALDFSNQNASNIKLADFNDWVDNGNSGASDTIDWTTGAGQKSTMTSATVTYSFTDPLSTTGWTRLTLKLLQDATGGRNAVFPANAYWPGGEPTWSDGASNEKIYVTAIYDAEADEYECQATDWR